MIKYNKLAKILSLILSLSLLIFLEFSTLELLAENMPVKDKEEVEINIEFQAENTERLLKTAPDSKKTSNQNNAASSDLNSKKKTVKKYTADSTKPTADSIEDKKTPVENKDQLLTEDKTSEKEEKSLNEKTEEIKNESKEIVEKKKNNNKEKPKSESETPKPKKEPVKTKVVESNSDQNNTKNKIKDDKIDDTQNKSIDKPAWLNELEKEKNEKEKNKDEKISNKKENKKFNLDKFISDLEKEDAVQTNDTKKSVKDTNDNNIKDYDENTEKSQNTQNSNSSRSNISKNPLQNEEKNNKDNSTNKVYDLTGEDNKNIEKPGIVGYSRPHYPENLRRRNIEGEVLLQLIVNKDGSSKNIEVFESSGYKNFDKTAVEAVSGWDFKPAVLNGEEISVKIILPLKFELAD